MPHKLAALTLVLMIGIVLIRVVLLRRQGIRAMKFGQLDRTDFLIPPFALFYLYIVFAAAFDWPRFERQQFFDAPIIARAGMACCAIGLSLLVWSIASFRRSFRVGIDAEHPNELVTDGIFAFSRNPIYVAFTAILIGEFLILPNWITLIYMVAAVALFHRQVLREEDHLRRHYGQAYVAYCQRVSRYF